MVAVPFLSTAALCACVVFLPLHGASALPAATGSYPGFSGIEYIFSFGDSYTQTGFNLTDGQPLPSPGNPLGNPPYPGYTSSSGPNWIDYLTVEFNKSKLLTYNVAYGGATIDSALVQPYESTVLSLKDQVESLFLPILGSKPGFAEWSADNSLFTFWIGINDVGNTYYRGDTESFYSVLMDAYFELIDELYDVGARNFLFLDVPPVDRSPLMTAQGSAAVALEKSALALYNGMLANRTTQLQSEKSGVWAQVFQASAVFNDILDNPADFGFKNATDFCEAYMNGTPEMDTFYPVCGVPVDEYFWMNNLHPTFPVHRVVAQRLAETL